MAMSPTRPNSDQAWMERALGLAREVRGQVWPNPPVGCVIVKDDHVVGEAATHPGGRPHAERKAINQAGHSAKGATLYVSLELCCHWGKTPPCVDAIIDAGIARVVCAVQDPDPRVNGGGFAKLREAGIHVDVGVCCAEARAVMSGFFHRVRTGMPELVKTATASARVPDGADAVLRTTETGLMLTTRTGMQGCPHVATDDVWRWLGDMGLTTVAVPPGDPMSDHQGYVSSRASQTADVVFETRA